MGRGIKTSNTESTCVWRVFFRQILRPVRIERLLKSTTSIESTRLQNPTPAASTNFTFQEHSLASELHRKRDNAKGLRSRLPSDTSSSFHLQPTQIGATQKGNSKEGLYSCPRHEQLPQGLLPPPLDSNMGHAPLTGKDRKLMSHPWP